jgi:hypothetical protein
MNEALLKSINQVFGSYSVYVTLFVLATLAFIYLAAQTYTLRTRSLELQGRRLDAVKILIDAMASDKALLAEESFILCYGFSLPYKEILYIKRRNNQHNLIFDLKYARYLIKLDFPGNDYKFEKRVSLNARRIASTAVYWISTIMAYVAFIAAVSGKAYVLFVFVGIFGFATYMSLEQLKSVSASQRILDVSQYPLTS